MPKTSPPVTSPGSRNNPWPSASFLICAGLLLAFHLAAAAPPPTVQQILGLLDRAGPAFRDMTAELKRTDYTPVLKETEVQTGLVRMKRSGQRGIRLYVEFTQPNPQILLFDRNEAQKYYPKLRLVEIYDLGKYRSLADQFLLLGFGTTGKELARSYEIKVLGVDRVAGREATRLELIPRDKKVLEVMKKAELWICPDGYPVQQKIFTSSTEYTFTYENIQLNTGLPDSALALKLPPDVKSLRPLR